MFSCSGAADTAEIGDRAVRQLHREGVAKMYCLAGIGGRVELILLNAQAGKTLVAVDGCDTDCAKRTLERAGFKDFVHVRVTDLGMEKGKTEVTPERIAAVAEKVRCAFGKVAKEEDQ